MDESQLDALIDALESSLAWRSGAPTAAYDLLGQPPDALTALQRARLTLLSIDEVVRARSPADAARTIRRVRDQAMSGAHRALRARAEHALSVLFREIGDPSAAVEHAVAALHHDHDELDPVLRCRLPLAMADAFAESGRHDDARSHYGEALDRSETMNVPWMTLHVLNNWSYAELRAADLEAAAGLADRLQTLADQHAMPVLLVYVGTVAEILHTRGRSGEAIALLRRHLSGDQPHPLIDAAGCWLILADIERETGALVAAGESLARADELVTTYDLPALRVHAVRLHAELCAARGDHVSAYALHRCFHSEALELRSGARETRARTLRAVHEVSEARRESTRYREMSHRDPLTTLYNRRYVDEDLDRRLADGAPSPSPWSTSTTSSASTTPAPTRPVTPSWSASPASSRELQPERPTPTPPGSVVRSSSSCCPASTCPQHTGSPRASGVRSPAWTGPTSPVTSR